MKKVDEHISYTALSGLRLDLLNLFIGFYPMRLYSIPSGLYSESLEGTQYKKDGSIPSATQTEKSPERAI